MLEKTKFIIIPLVGILVISFFINLQTYSAKKTVERERNELKIESESFAKKIEAILKDNQQLKDKITLVYSDLDRVSTEKQQLQVKYELATKERDELMEKLKIKPVKEAQKEGVAETEDAYWAGILKEKTGLALQLENIQNELNALKTNNEQLTRDLSSLSQEKKELEQKFSYNQNMFDNMSSALVIEKNARRQLEENLKLKKKDNLVLRQQLKSLINRKANLEKKLTKLQQEKFNLEGRFNEMALLLEDNLRRGLINQRQLDALSSGSKEEILQLKKESVELPPIVVRPQSEGPQTEKSVLQRESTPAGYGRVLEVNRENNFAIIDLGENAGIKVGDTFDVYRENELIATIEVVQSRKNVAACDIKKEITSIRLGDTVK